LRRHKITIPIPLELSNNEAIKTRGEGLGIAVITRRVVSKEIEMGTLRAIPCRTRHEAKILSDPPQGQV